MIEITSTIPRTVRRLQSWERRATTALGGVVQRLGAQYLAALEAATPRGKGDANGRKRLVDSYQVTQRGAVVRITNRAPHLKYVLKGRGPVVALSARALRFVIGGRVFFRRRVKGAKANNYPVLVRRQMAGAIRQAGRDAADAVRRAF